MSTIIDRRGAADALDGFDHYMSKADAPLYWSIWHGRRLKDVCFEDDYQESRKMFDTLLQVWQRNGAAGVMEIRFHQKKPNQNITNNSEYVGSFGFKLSDDVSYNRSGGAAMPVEDSSMSKMLREFQAFQALQAMMQPAVGAIGAVDDTPKTIWDRIEQFLTVPVVEDFIAGVMKKFDVDMSQINREGSIAGDPDNTDGEVLSYEDTTRLDAVIARLAVGEKDVIGLLEKLADLKEKKPKQYAMAKTFL